MSKLPDITLPVWMNQGEPLTLAHASTVWWERVYEWLTFPLAQIDVDTCDEQLLTLLAYQRDIDRFPGESLTLFRLRVKYAFVNAQDAGSKAGFARIFERLHIGQIQQLERQLWLDWDVILLRINDAQLSRDNTLMMNLVRQYGRTCRRYFFDVLNQRPLSIRAGRFDLHTGYHCALFVPTFEIVRFHVNGWMASTFEPVTSFAGATYMIEAQGAVGDTVWNVDGSATVASMGKDCQVTITGLGVITVTGTDTRDRIVTHTINPALWFIQDGTKGLITEAEAWASRVWGRLPLISELTYRTPADGKNTQRGFSGALWSEWGDMAVYGWPGAPVAGALYADWWLTLSPASQPPNNLYLPILAGTHNRAEEYSSNGTVATTVLTNTNAFRRCAIWEAVPFQIAGFTVNGWDTPTFDPVTSFAGATYNIRLLGQFGPVIWAITGPATINAGAVTITGPGDVTVRGINSRGEAITHRFAPTRYFIPCKAQMLQDDMPAFLAANKGLMPSQDDMTSHTEASNNAPLYRQRGHLWNEWGNLGVYGWLESRGTNNNQEEHYATTTQGMQADTHRFVRIRTGVGTDIGATNTNKFAVAAVIDLPTGKGK
jgi:hypothetical protein